MIVPVGGTIPITTEFTLAKQAPEETAMIVARDALASAIPIIDGDSAYDTSTGTTICWPQESCQSPRMSHVTQKSAQNRVPS